MGYTLPYETRTQINKSFLKIFEHDIFIYFQEKTDGVFGQPGPTATLTWLRKLWKLVHPTGQGDTSAASWISQPSPLSAINSHFRCPLSWGFQKPMIDDRRILLTVFPWDSDCGWSHPHFWPASSPLGLLRLGAGCFGFLQVSCYLLWWRVYHTWKYWGDVGNILIFQR